MRSLVPPVVKPADGVTAVTVRRLKLRTFMQSDWPPFSAHTTYVWFAADPMTSPDGLSLGDDAFVAVRIQCWRRGR